MSLTVGLGLKTCILLLGRPPRRPFFVQNLAEVVNHHVLVVEAGDAASVVLTHGKNEEKEQQQRDPHEHRKEDSESRQETNHFAPQSTNTKKTHENSIGVKPSRTYMALLQTVWENMALKPNPARMSSCCQHERQHAHIFSPLFMTTNPTRRI